MNERPLSYLLFTFEHTLCDMIKRNLSRMSLILIFSYRLKEVTDSNVLPC